MFTGYTRAGAGSGASTCGRVAQKSRAWLLKRILLRSSRFDFLSPIYDITALSAEFQGKYAEAERLYERCQAIEEKVLGPEHPSLATTLHNRASLLKAQVRAIRISQELIIGSTFRR